MSTKMIANIISIPAKTRKSRVCVSFNKGIGSGDFCLCLTEVCSFPPTDSSSELIGILKTDLNLSPSFPL